MTRRALAAGVAALVTMALGVLTLPHRPALGTASGDARLVQDVRPLLGEGHATVSVALVELDATRFAHFGADGRTTYEIGSVAKAMTSMLLADAVERGDVRLDDAVGDHLDLGDSDAADVTLAELASHRSGLPRIGGGVGAFVGGWLAGLRHRNPYDATPADVLDRARHASLDDRGTFAYSNLGGALLGLALAEQAGTDYAALLHDRLLEPLGMTDTSVPESEGDAPTHGWSAGGLPEEPWVLDGFAPAGGVRSTVADLATLVRALLDGTAPGAASVTPRWEADGGDRIGLAWFTTEDGVTWHNGGTGGYRSIVALDRAHDRGVVVLADTAIDVDDVGFRLLEERR